MATQIGVAENVAEIVDRIGVGNSVRLLVLIHKRGDEAAQLYALYTVYIVGFRTFRYERKVYIAYAVVVVATCFHPDIQAETVSDVVQYTVG